ncbi:hypothetical protein RBI80_01460 [Klebsiella variicola]|nr:hypothetical protein RBI80_01460 [Klebsiella variicola]
MQIVKQSMAKGWQGLFELKGGSGQRDVEHHIPTGYRDPAGIQGRTGALTASAARKRVFYALMFTKKVIKYAQDY